jgi:hypothetical protein
MLLSFSRRHYCTEESTTEEKTKPEEARGVASQSDLQFKCQVYGYSRSAVRPSLPSCLLDRPSQPARIRRGNFADTL